MSSFAIRRNDTAPSISSTLTDADGVAISIAGATVRFHMKQVSGDLDTTPVKVDAAANNDEDGGGSTGEVSYDWVAADTDTAGWFQAEWEVTFSDGTIRSFPNPGFITVRISGDVA